MGEVPLYADSAARPLPGRGSSEIDLTGMSKGGAPRSAAEQPSLPAAEQTSSPGKAPSSSAKGGGSCGGGKAGVAEPRQKKVKLEESAAERGGVGSASALLHALAYRGRGCPRQMGR